MKSTLLKRISRAVLALSMVAIGIDHFLNPAPFEQIVPTWLPSPHALVLVSGFFEMAGGIGLLVPGLRRFAAWGLIALFVAVFPANVNMAINHIQLTSGGSLPPWVMWARLPFQGLFIAWAYWFAKDRPSSPKDPRASGRPR